MSKFKSRYINYADRSFKKKFDNLINDERKSNNKINLTVTKILKEILEKGDEGLNYFDCIEIMAQLEASCAKDGMSFFGKVSFNKLISKPNS